MFYCNSWKRQFISQKQSFITILVWFPCKAIEFHACRCFIFHRILRLQLPFYFHLDRVFVYLYTSRYLYSNVFPSEVCSRCHDFVFRYSLDHYCGPLLCVGLADQEQKQRAQVVNSTKLFGAPQPPCKYCKILCYVTIGQ